MGEIDKTWPMDGSYPPGDGLDYVRQCYGVDVALGQRVVCDGEPGTVVWDRRFPSHYVHVQFDDGRRAPSHPTWRMEYDVRPESEEDEA